MPAQKDYVCRICGVPAREHPLVTRQSRLRGMTLEEFLPMEYIGTDEDARLFECPDCNPRNAPD